MNRAENGLPSAEDVTPKRSPLKRLSLVAMGLLMSCAIAIGGWWTYKNVYEMHQLRQSLQESVSIVSTAPLTAKHFKRYPALTEAQLGHFVSDLLADEELDIPSAKRTTLIKNALNLSQRLGYTRSIIAEAWHMEHGYLPGFSEQEIQKKYAEAFSESQIRAKSGNAADVYAYIENLVKDKSERGRNSKIASSMLLSIIRDLSEYELNGVPALSLLYMNNFNAEKHMSAYTLERHRRGLDFEITYVNLSCSPMPGEEIKFREKNYKAKCIIGILKPYLESHRFEIAREFSYEPNVLKLLGLNEKFEEINTQKKDKSQAKHDSSADTEGFPTDDTGYVKGEPIRHAGGLSTFEVDNTGTNRDAVVRIYLNGNKPASRTILVKAGERFIAKNIAPGNYKMRYRFSDTKKVFEAKTLFTVSQEKTETGTRYSQITVTLYKTKDGNMQTEEVSEDDF